MEGAYLDETGIDQNTRTDRIHRATDDRGGGSSRVVSRPDTQARSNADWGGKTVEKRGCNWDPVMLFVNLKEGESRAYTKTLEGFCRVGEQRKQKETDGID